MKPEQMKPLTNRDKCKRHNLEKVEKKKAAVPETGHEAYWEDAKKPKLFSDEAGTHEISKSVT